MTNPCPVPIHHWHLPVGYFIGILAFLGVVVPWLRPPEKLGRTEKAIWTLAFLALLVLELRSISFDQQETAQMQAQVQCEELQHFQGVAQQIGGVLQTTQEVSKLAKENLESITGGNSFAYLIPSTTILPGHQNALDFSTDIQNDGNQILSNVSVSLARVFREGPGGSIFGTTTDLASMSPVTIGSLAPHELRMIPNIFIEPRTFVNGQGHYIATIYAQNGWITEQVYLRPAKSGVGWAYRLSVSRISKGKEITLKSVNWTEPESDIASQ